MNTEACLRCGSPPRIGFHPCDSRIIVVHPKVLLETRAKANPLDRLTVAEMMRIYGEDPDETIEEDKRLLEEANEEYLGGPLTYRVELQTMTGLGFQGSIDHWAIEADGGTDCDLAKVLNFLNSEERTIVSLRKDEIYLCRLVSVNSEGRKYVWSVNRLEFDGGWNTTSWN